MKESKILQDKELQRKKLFKSNLNNYIEFIELFRKKRPLVYQNEVLELINKEKSIVARINQIKEIDSKWKDKLNPDTSIDDVKKQNISKSIDKKTINQKKEIQKKNFLNYLFGERPALIRFGKRTNTIDFPFFGIIKKITPEAVNYIQKIVTDCSNDMKNIVKNIIKQKWDSLEAYEYNVFVELSKLIDIFESERANIDIGSPKIFKTIKKIIIPFITITQDRNNIELIKNTLYELYKYHKDYSEKLSKIVSTINELFNNSKQKLTIQNIILAYLMVSLNRFIKINHLFDEYSYSEIDKEKFNFSPDIREFINSFISKLKNESIDAEKQLSTLVYYDDDFDALLEGRSRFSHLFDRIFLYKKYRTVAEIKSARKNIFDNSLVNIMNKSSNIGDFVFEFIKGFLDIYEDVLVNSIQMQIDNQDSYCNIFDNSLFENEIMSLKDFNESALYFIQNTNKTASVKDYKNYLYNRQSNNNDKLFIVIENATKAINRIQYNIALFLENHKKSFSNTRSTDNNPLKNIDDLSRPIPYYDFKISKKDVYHSNITIGDLLKEISHICANFSLIIGDDDSLRALDRKSDLMEIVEKYLFYKAKFC